MIQISISRASLGQIPLVIDDTGTGVYTLQREFNTGRSEADNTYAESRWQDGGLLTSTRRQITKIDFLLRIKAGSLPGTVAAIDTLAEALDQFAYTVTISQETAVRTYDCMPADWERSFDPVQMRHDADLVKVSIPRQP